MPRFITSDGEKIFYEVFGEGGDPLIFIHPPLMGHVVFKYQRKLQDHHQVILMDLRGHGHSVHSPKDFSLSRHVEDIKELMDHLGHSKTTLVGYSAGGSLVLDFATKYPERINALILSGGFPKVGTWLLYKQFQIGIALMKQQKVTFLSKVLAWSHKVTPVDQMELFRYGERANPQVVLDLYQECMIYNCVDELHRLQEIPVLVMYGTRSKHTNAHAKWFEAFLPNVKIGFVDHGTHQLPTRFHEPFNHAIRHFLKENLPIGKP